jgi:hypothetical protein
MGERYKDVEESSVCLCVNAQSRQLLMHNMIAMKTYHKSSVILTEKRKRLSFCWRVVRP